MSMKRSKPTSRGRNRDSADSPIFSTKTDEPKWSWKEHVATKPDAEFVPYALSEKFAARTLILHPTFGKGIVTQVDGARIEVLFEGGSKKLGHANPTT